MKKYVMTLIGWAMAILAFAQDDPPPYPPSRNLPENIVAAEYFVDNDPGFGQGIALALTPAGNISNTTVSINVNGLSNGIHRLYIRVRNAEGSWSLVSLKEFLYDQDPFYTTTPLAPKQIIAAEYFIDTDPGYGKGTAIAISPGVDISTVPVPVNVNGLSNGNHRLHIRSQNADGSWSQVIIHEFSVDFNPPYANIPLAPENIVAAEYFFDIDPGHGLGTSIPITPGTDLSNLSTNVQTSALSVGSHRVYLRTKNQEGKWSITRMLEFVVNLDPEYATAPPAAKPVVAAEYFIDTDPGAGKGQAIPITPNVELNTINVQAATNGLALGIHRLYLRTRSTEGHWSITEVREFSVSEDPDYTPAPLPAQNVVAAEYFIDTDPGMGKGITIPVAPATDISNINVVVNTAGLSDAFHRLYIRTRNQEGRWSITYDSAFYVGTLVPSWTLEPAGGHDFGNVVVNATGNFNFTIRNTGDAPLTLTNVTLGDPAFKAVFTANTVITARNTLTIPVSFKPTGVGAYTAELKVTTSTAGVAPATTQVSGHGYTPATPPVLKWVTSGSYGGNTGVDPGIGQPGLFTYKIVYQSADNRAPQAGYPKVGIDLNGDQDFDDLGEGTFAMTKAGTGTDYAAGVTYEYSFNQEAVNNSMGYQFFAADANGNTGNSAFKTGPVVTYNQPDLRIFANDITFSKSNPRPGEAFTVTARVSNSTAHAATDVKVKFYRENTPIDSVVIATINGNSNVTVSRTLQFEFDGFFPIKVWVDSANTLGDVNILNNYAIRPITVGAPALPGGITLSASHKLQTCPQVSTVISGKAVYFGTGTATAVAGAEVTIKLGTLEIKTTTNSNGDFSYLLPNTVCGSSLTYTVSVTDFTFTSSLLTKAISIPCSSTTECLPPRNNGGAVIMYNTSPCTKVVGGNAQLGIKLKYRESDINNMWRANDDIRFDTLRLYKNGVLFYEFGSADAPWAPGNERIINEFVPLNSTDPVTIRAVLTYTYVEYRQIPSPTYHGSWQKITVEGSSTFTPDAAESDLDLRNFKQTGHTSFSFDNANLRCVDAGAHNVNIYDSIPGGSFILLHSHSLPGVMKGNAVAIGYSKADLAPGRHYLRIVTDADGMVSEADEANNVLDAMIVVPETDLLITALKPSSTYMPKGETVTFSATVKNQGRQAGPFKVGFSIGGVALGTKKAILGLGENATITVVSDPYVIPSDEKECGFSVRAVADVDNEVNESSNSNNADVVSIGTDLVPFQRGNETGSGNNPAVIRVHKEGQFFPAVRNYGNRDVRDVTVKYTLNGVRLGGEVLPIVKAGEQFRAAGSFKYTFTTPGDYVVQVEADTSGQFCETAENNNTGTFHIRVVDSKQDLEVLSQYISPSSLNPASGQSITLVGTVKNTGGKASQANVLRFLVDDIQLGADVAINGLQPGKDTTVEATANYSSLITGVKVMKIVVDPANTADEEREDNNVATRTLIVGAAPDLAANGLHPISFNPSGFKAGDSVTISYAIRNKGTQNGSAWVRFLILSENGSVTAIDSVEVSLAGGANTVASVKMLFSNAKGSVIAEIVNASPAEFDLINNTATQTYSAVVALDNNITVAGDLDMKNGLPGQLPGWIGGKLVLGDHDLVINGTLKNFDADHFVVTNGTGKLTIANNDADKVFPVGTTEGSSNFLKIQNAGVPDQYSVGVLPYVLKQGTSGDTIRQGFVNRTWLIEEGTIGGSNATVTFYWDATHEQPLFDRDQSRAAHYTSTWDLGDQGTAAIDSIGRYRKVQTGYTSFSPFAVASGSGALPIRLISFNVSVRQKDAELVWRSEAEVDTKHFVVEHSADGAHFTAVGTVTAMNAAGVHTYRFTHHDLSDGPHYYRLRMVDQDETFTHSMIRRVEISNQATMRVFPNPAQGRITISGLATNGIVRIMTMDGKPVKLLRTQGTTLVADVSGLAQGTYVVQYNNQGQQQQVILIKQ
ncbi:CARDB domain-containing protein [Paraflavitalea sp. CAU 1676]|uniref:CARDB domain-containing protein n=1 Tax=Paraflavitalea sp. CAU 1676 TaxID=3032598 RepID=UPI0023DA2B7E|nr:CARDB domain-containing protein [Paraflavitalea sp. CAU 1676]MDF2193707.1 CARDB domain-containing protein [Paraflavitalea sp. CAU 1676]